MQARYLITIAGAALLSTSALASGSTDRMNGGFDRADSSPAALNSAAPAAAPSMLASIDQLPKSSRVTLRGTVQNVDGMDEFTLSDSTGSIEVELSSAATVKEGETITVVGDVEREWGKRQLENAVITNTGITAESSGAITKVK